MTTAAAAEVQVPEVVPPTRPPSRMGGRRPGAGRPKGARNKIAAQVKELLAPLDSKAIDRLEKIIANGNDREALEAIRLAWEYRYGKPQLQGDGMGGMFAAAVTDTAVLIAAGDERAYVAALRRARGDVAG